MNLVLRKATLLQALILKPFSRSNAPFSFQVTAFNFSSASLQQSLDVGDNSAGEVHAEAEVQQSASVEKRTEVIREELGKRALYCERVQEQVDPEQAQQGHLRGAPLRVVIQNCVTRWFKEHVKLAEKGDSDAQVMVGQMMSHGYGVPKDVLKGEEWIRRAQPSKRRSKQSKDLQDKKGRDSEDLFFM